MRGVGHSRLVHLHLWIIRRAPIPSEIQVLQLFPKLCKQTHVSDVQITSTVHWSRAYERQNQCTSSTATGKRLCISPCPTCPGAIAQGRRNTVCESSGPPGSDTQALVAALREGSLIPDDFSAFSPTGPTRGRLGVGPRIYRHGTRDIGQFR